MFRLGPQRFGEFYLGQKDVAAAIVELRRTRMIEIHVLAEDGFFIDALVVNGDFVVGDVVVNDHLAGTHDDHLAHFLRIQPAHMDVGHDLAGINDVEEDDVVDPRLHVVHALPENARGLEIPQPVLDDADVMRGEVPERVNIRADAAEVEALAVDVAHITKLPGVDHFLHVANGGVVNEGVARHHDEPPLYGLGAKFIDLDRAGGQRFLDEDVLARLQGATRELEMTCRRRGNDDRMNSRVIKNDIDGFHGL